MEFIKGTEPIIHKLLTELFPKKEYFDKVPKVNIIPKTPSGQKWNLMTDEQKAEWRQTIRLLGEDPEVYIDHMRRMLPMTPRGRR